MTSPLERRGTRIADLNPLFRYPASMGNCTPRAKSVSMLVRLFSTIHAVSVPAKGTVPPSSIPVSPSVDTAKNLNLSPSTCVMIERSKSIIFLISVVKAWYVSLISRLEPMILDNSLVIAAAPSP
ncbi:hypothetical protein ES703_121367 [subsurface metagenome]